MRLLALETATADCSVALAIDGALFQAVARPGSEKPSEQVPGLIRQVLAEAGIGLVQLDAIAFDSGPGAFTGIRIGCGLAQGMALGADLPLIALSSLRVLAMQAPEGRVLAMLDARMGEVYWSLFERCAAAGRPYARALADARVEPPSGWVCPPDIDCALGDGLSVDLLPPGSRHMEPAGDGIVNRRMADRIPPGVRLLGADARPRAVDMLPLAEAEFAAGLALPPEQASPLYVRDKVALTAAEQLARRAAR